MKYRYTLKVHAPTCMWIEVTGEHASHLLLVTNIKQQQLVPAGKACTQTAAHCVSYCSPAKSANGDVVAVPIHAYTAFNQADRAADGQHCVCL